MPIRIDPNWHFVYLNNMNTCESITIDIYLGLKEGYDGIQHSEEELIDYLQEIITQSASGLCVSVIPTKYIYVNGKEEGVIVRLINYPRFPNDIKSLKDKAIDLGWKLKDQFKQYRISIQTPDLTYMLGL